MIKNLTTSFSLFVGIAVLVPTPAQAAVLTVCPSGCSFTTVQDAVDAAAWGDTISLGAGTHAGQVSIGADRYVIIDGGGSAVLDADGDASALTVEAWGHVLLRDVEITGVDDTVMPGSSTRAT